MERPSPTLRRPSDRPALYAWHEDALDALAESRCDNLKDAARDYFELVPPIVEGEPCCGWYKVRLHRDGVFVPARIFLEQRIDETGELLADERLRCQIGDEMVDPVAAWPTLCSRPIPASEYAYLVAVRGWAKSSATDQPQAAESRPIDWLTVKMPAVPPAPPKPKKRLRNGRP